MIGSEKVSLHNDEKYKITGLNMFNYGLGNMGISIVWTVIASFLSMYLTDNVGIAAATVGTIMILSRVFDGFSDVIMGNIVDRTRTKWGKARPLVFWMSIPLAITFILLFSVPTSFNGVSKIIYVFITYNLVSTVFYTASSIPYGALLSLISKDQISRSNTNIVKTAMGAVASLIVSMATLRIVNKFGGGSTGWTAMAIIYGVVVIITCYITFRNTREVNTGGFSTAKREKLGFKKSAELILSNKYLVIILFFSIVISMANFPGLNMYYAKYILENPNAIGTIALVTTLSQVPVIFMLPPLIKRFGKRNCSIGGFIIYLIGCAVAFINPANQTLVLIACGLRGFGLAPAGLCQVAFVSDTVEYGEWKNGKRTEGLVHSIVPFGNKLGTGLGTAIVSWCMAIGGYNGLALMQSQSALASIRGIFLYAPILIGVGSIILLLFYNLDKEYDSIVEDLENGEHNASDI